MKTNKTILDLNRKLADMKMLTDLQKAANIIADIIQYTNLDINTVIGENSMFTELVKRQLK